MEKFGAANRAEGAAPPSSGCPAGHNPAAAARLPGTWHRETTMQAFENTVTIQRPQEEVFAFLADFENIPRWNYAIDQTSKASAGPVGVGTRYHQTRSVPNRSVEDFEVTVFEPARRLAIHGQIGPFQAQISYELEPAPGATRLVNNVELDSSPAALRLVAPLAIPKIKAAVAENLGKLKQVLEGQPSA
jgi:hypothetical protein